MLSVSNFYTIPRNLSFSTIIVFCRNPWLVRLVAARMASNSLKIVAEYAKSGRSSCKECAKVIAASSLRLGLVTRDPRGFDMTKWHHCDCFPFNSNSFTSTEEIEGFDVLKSSDQTMLKKLVSEGGGSKAKINMKDVDEVHDEERGHSKKFKLSLPIEGCQLDIAFSGSEIKSKYKDATLLPKWKAFQTIIFLEGDEGFQHSSKIAAFDFDGCLAKTSVKRVGANEWSLMYPSIPGKLRSLYDDGFKLVIFTNEANIEKWKNRRQKAVDSKLGRLEQFMTLVEVPIQVFIACGLTNVKPEDPFRKPQPGMWHIMEKQFNSGIPIDMDLSFYVGDAAGRLNDHSDADIKFAKAVGLKFFLPEDYF